jgi:hypothetical protein
MDYSQAPLGYRHDTVELPVDVMTWCQLHILHGFQWEMNYNTETVFDLSTKKNIERICNKFSIFGYIQIFTVLFRIGWPVWTFRIDISRKT